MVCSRAISTSWPLPRSTPIDPSKHPTTRPTWPQGARVATVSEDEAPPWLLLVAVARSARPSTLTETPRQRTPICAIGPSVGPGAAPRVAMAPRPSRRERLAGAGAGAGSGGTGATGGAGATGAEATALTAGGATRAKALAGVLAESAGATLADAEALSSGRTAWSGSTARLTAMAIEEVSSEQSLPGARSSREPVTRPRSSRISRRPASERPSRRTVARICKVAPSRKGS